MLVSKAFTTVLYGFIPRLYSTVGAGAATLLVSEIEYFWLAKPKIMIPSVECGLLNISEIATKLS